MGSVAEYKYPDLDAKEAERIADVLVNEHNGDVSSEEAFAQDVGHSSAKSGTYKQKIADCRKYGLLPSRGVEATDLAFKLANPKNDKIRGEAMFEMYRNINLLDDLYTHLDGRDPPEELWRVLTEISDAKPKEAKEAAGEVDELYREMLRFKPSEDEEGEEGEADSEIIEETHEPTPPGNTEDGIYLSIGNDSLQLEEESVMNLELAITMLEQKKQEKMRALDEDQDDTEVGQSDTDLTEYAE